VSRTLEQKRAGDAYRKVQQLTNQSETFQKNYSSYAKGLPATILANGLGQAAAYLMAAAKGEETDAHMVLYRHLQDWLCRDNDNRAPYPGARDLMGAITSEGRDKYLHAQAEAMEWLSWLKKFAAALLKQPESDNE